MNTEKDLLFASAIATEIKRSFECPIILLTQKDYADEIFNSMVSMHNALLHNELPERITEIINTFHIGWLQAVQDIENFKKRAKDTPRETIFQSIDYTIECMEKRLQYFQKYIKQVNKSIMATEPKSIEADMKVLEDLRKTITFTLIEKKKCLVDSADKADFLINVLNEIEELLNWLDKLYDNLAMQFCKMLNLCVPLLPTDLTKTHDQIIHEMARHSIPESREIAEVLRSKVRTLGSMARVESSVNDLGITEIVKKIKLLEGRIARLKNEKSAGLMALEHKMIFLKDRIESLENLKKSLCFLKKQKTKHYEHEHQEDKSSPIEENDVCIFNHLLPHPERFRLVDKLFKLWKAAIDGNDMNRSFISILSPSRLKLFSDDIGHFTVDKYGRKIYTKEGDHQVYQLNERNELVPVNDDEKHIYYYDECGRYYLTKKRQRVYKAHATANEYSLHKSGFMLMVSEIEDDIEYWYDNLGRYYVNEDGDHVYREKGSTDEYRTDGLGNLVKIKNEEDYYLETCPIEPMVTEECNYLKQTIGPALKRCVAEVVVALPQDPIKHLADRLEKYWSSMVAREKRLLEEQQLMAERERLKTLEHISPVKEPSLIIHRFSSGTTATEEESVNNYDFMHYESQL